MVGFYLLLVVFKRPVASSLAYVNRRKMAGVLRQSVTVTAACPKAYVWRPSNGCAMLMKQQGHMCVPLQLGVSNVMLIQGFGVYTCL